MKFRAQGAKLSDCHYIVIGFDSEGLHLRSYLDSAMGFLATPILIMELTFHRGGPAPPPIHA